MSVTATYSAPISRVIVAATAVGASAVTALVQRSTDQVRWSTVRGGSSVPVVSQVIDTLNDYEFTPGVINYYKVTGKTSGGGTASTQTGQITPVITDVWLKSITRPFLNRKLVLTGAEPEFATPARAGIFQIVGRSLPVVVSDLRGSRQYTLEALTETLDERVSLELMLASGDPLYLQPPAGHPVLTPAYVTIGGATHRRPLPGTSTRYLFTLSMTEIAAPGSTVVGTTITWANVLADYALWQNLVTDTASWSNLLDRVGTAEDVIVA